MLESCVDLDDRTRVEKFFTRDLAPWIASDIDEPVEIERYLVTTYRVLRDTALARRIKADNDYRCQLCGTQILLSKGNPYAEAHHVRPLGPRHGGPDHPGNIVCVCPNCHVKLDYGAIEINQNILRNVLPEYIQYHNEHIFTGMV